jgi:hypothetical protein
MCNRLAIELTLPEVVSSSSMILRTSKYSSTFSWVEASVACSASLQSVMASHHDLVPVTFDYSEVNPIGGKNGGKV